MTRAVQSNLRNRAIIFNRRDIGKTKCFVASRAAATSRAFTLAGWARPAVPSLEIPSPKTMPKRRLHCSSSSHLCGQPRRAGPDRHDNTSQRIFKPEARFSCMCVLAPEHRGLRGVVLECSGRGEGCWNPETPDPGYWANAISFLICICPEIGE